MVNLLVKTESSNENNYFQIDILKFRFFFLVYYCLKAAPSAVCIEGTDVNHKKR